MSFVWKVEDMALMNEKSNIYIGNEKIYKAENELTREEKIEFLDSMNDGLTSYILGLADKLKEDKANGVIKKGKYGQMSAISFAAWIKRNDTRNCVDIIYDRGSINFTPYRNINMLNTNISMFRGSTYTDYVDEAFHIKLKELEMQERQYFREHDEYEILKAKVSEYLDKYGTFGLNIWKTSRGLYFYKNDDANSLGRQITLDELKLFYSKYEEMDKLYAKITKELPRIDYDHEYMGLNENSKIPYDSQGNKLHIGDKCEFLLDVTTDYKYWGAENFKNRFPDNPIINGKDDSKYIFLEGIVKYDDADERYVFDIQGDYGDFYCPELYIDLSTISIVKNLDYNAVHEESGEENTTISGVVEDYLDKSEIDLD